MEDATWSISQEACLPSPATSLPVSPNLLLFPFLLKKKKTDFLLNKWFYMVCKNDLEQKKKKKMEHKD